MLRNILICLYIVLNCAIVVNCSAFTNNKENVIKDDYNTISLPPQKLNSSNVAVEYSTTHIGHTVVSTSVPKVASQPYVNHYPQSYQENRSNGTVNEIKVDNRNLPDYYMYPSQQNDSTANYNSKITTPNWQISW